MLFTLFAKMKIPTVIQWGSMSLRNLGINFLDFNLFQFNSPSMWVFRMLLNGIYDFWWTFNWKNLKFLWCSVFENYRPVELNDLIAISWIKNPGICYSLIITNKLINRCKCECRYNWHFGNAFTKQYSWFCSLWKQFRKLNLGCQVAQ